MAGEPPVRGLPLSENRQTIRKRAVTFTVMTTLLLVGSWVADAATWSGASRMKAAAENYTPIDNAQVNGCAVGYRWNCNASGSCRCQASR